jgi:hypothetical protein
MTVTNMTGETFGFELEVENVLSNNMHIPGFCNRDHDASVEGISRLSSLRLEDVEGQKVAEILGIGNNVTSGFEIVSQPINFSSDNWKGQLKTLLNDLMKRGETEISERASIHIHVYCPVNPEVFKNIIRLGKITENLFFRIGGMGYKHRGLSNSYAYCRPFSGKGPHVVHVNQRGRYGQCLNIEDILNRQFSFDEIGTYWGDLLNGNGKYVPVRYLWLNPRNIILSLIGNRNAPTLEFRIFNKSLNFKYFIAIIALCCEFVKVCYSKLPKQTEDIINPFNVDDSEHLVKILNTYFSDIDPSHLKTLEEIIYMSHPIAVPDEFVFSHLLVHPTRGDQTHVHWDGRNYSTPQIANNLIKKPNIIDSHLLKMQQDAKRTMPKLKYLDITTGRIRDTTEIIPEINRIDDDFTPPDLEFDDNIDEELADEQIEDRIRLERERRDFHEFAQQQLLRNRERPDENARANNEQARIRPVFTIDWITPLVETNAVPGNNNTELNATLPATLPAARRPRTTRRNT